MNNFQASLNLKYIPKQKVYYETVQNSSYGGETEKYSYFFDLDKFVDVLKYAVGGREIWQLQKISTLSVEMYILQ